MKKLTNFERFERIAFIVVGMIAYALVGFWLCPGTMNNEGWMLVAVIASELIVFISLTVLLVMMYRSLFCEEE